MRKNVKGLLISTLCGISVMSAPLMANASEISELEAQASALRAELAGINQEILGLGNQVAETEAKIQEADLELEQTQQQLAIAKMNEDNQYEDMKLRIQYMYENDTSSWVEVVLSSESFSEFINNVEFVTGVMSYDRQKLEDLHELQVTIAAEEERVKEEKENLVALEAELQTRQAQLNARAAATSTNIQGLTSTIASLRQAEAEAAARREAEQQAASNSNSSNGSSGSSSSSGSKGQSSGSSGSTASSKPASSSSGSYTASSSGLTPQKGVVYYDGHKETYYSQKVLPGGGLNIPGRHVASDGTIRDADGYICVASSDHSKGTVVNTSLGPGKVYDSGCKSGTIDLYTNW